MRENERCYRKGRHDELTNAGTMKEPRQEKEDERQESVGIYFTQTPPNKKFNEPEWRELVEDSDKDRPDVVFYELSRKQEHADSGEDITARKKNLECRNEGYAEANRRRTQDIGERVNEIEER